MRLLNTHTFRLEEHLDSRLPEYAILSHRWGTDEVNYGDITSQRDFSQKQGFEKLKNFCDLARDEGYKYAWADTCCIDKDSSAELGTALNSMYRWYADAHLCIAYLFDTYEGGKPMCESEWFRRGWTLQELIAPVKIVFYDRYWKLLGTKKKLLQPLSITSGVPESILDHTVEPRSCSIAQRMSWAAHRQTERVEDRAYSLMGLFGVTIEMMYGKREDTFIRLQEEILKHSADQSIFAWSLDPYNHPHGYSGLLAPSPSSFAGCNSVLSLSERREFSITNVGLSVKLWTFPYSSETYMAFLDCGPRERPGARCAILLARLQTEGQYARVVKSAGVSMIVTDCPEGLDLVERQLYVRQLLLEHPYVIMYGFRLRTMQPPGHAVRSITVDSRAPSSCTDQVLLDPGQHGTAGIVLLERHFHDPHIWSEIHQLRLGFDAEFHPHLLLMNDKTVYTRVASSQSPTRGRRSQAPDPNQETLRAYEYFDNSWLSWRPRVTPPSKTTGWKKGYCHLKVDKNKGFEGVYDGLNLGIKVKLLRDPSVLRSDRRTQALSPRVWTVDLTDIGGTSPERELDKLRRNQRNAEAAVAHRENVKELWSRCFALVCVVLVYLFIAFSVIPWSQI